jgi:Zn-dependent protease
MRNPAVGSFGLGRWLGIPVRLHVAFVLLAAFVLYGTKQHELFHGHWLHGAILLVVWFACVLLHEAGHCIAVARLGGTNDLLVFSPVGGISEYNYLHEPQPQLLVALAGPFANLAGGLAAGCLLAGLGQSSFSSVANPFAPVELFEGGQLLFGTLRVALWVNWILVLVNLFPAVPLDGGWALHALVWPALGPRKAKIVVRRLSFAVAVALFAVAAWLMFDPVLTPVPTWLPMVALGLLIACYALAPVDSGEALGEDDELLGYDFSQGYTSLEHAEPPPARPGFIRRWLEHRRHEREVRRIRIEYEEERQVDSILARLHEHGIETLSAEERSLLDRVSARYRARSRQ